MDLRETCLQSGNKIEIILERQIRMQPADNVELRDRLGVSGSRRLKRFFERHGVSAGSVFLASESAQAARRNTNIRGINMAVDVEISHIAVHARTYRVGQPAQSENVRRKIERDPFLQAQPLARKYLIGNRLEARIVRLKSMTGLGLHCCGPGELDGYGS